MTARLSGVRRDPTRRPSQRPRPPYVVLAHLLLTTCVLGMVALTVTMPGLRASATAADVSDSFATTAGEVSLDRSTWAAIVRGPSFDLESAWRPGDEQQLSLWVRRRDGGDLDLSVRASRPVPEAATRLLRLAARVDDDGPWQPMGAWPGKAAQIEARHLQAGRATPVTLRASYLGSVLTGGRAMADALDLRISVVGSLPGVGPQAGPDPPTGLILAPLFLCCAMLGAVGILVRRRRRMPWAWR